jgi:hypothetical protein
MRFLRDAWQRGPIHQFFVGLEPIDRATFLILTALALALGLTLTALTARWREQELTVPASIAPPLEMRKVRA